MKPRLFIYGPSSSGKTIFKNLSIISNIYYIINYIDNYMHINQYSLSEFDKVIYTFRDPRICWLLSDDKIGGLYNVKKMIQDVDIVKFCEWYEHEFFDWNNISEYNNTIMFKFEDVLLNYHIIVNKIFNFLNIKANIDFYKPDVLVPGRFTRFDIDKIVKYMKIVKQKDFDYISDRLNNVISLLGYPDYLELKTITK